MDTKILDAELADLYYIAREKSKTDWLPIARAALSSMGALAPSVAAGAPMPEWGTTRDGAVRADADAQKMAMRDFGLKDRGDSAAFDFGAGFSRGVAFGRATAPVAPAAVAPQLAVNADDLDFTPDEQHAVADMANIGKTLLERIDVPGLQVERIADRNRERPDQRARRRASQL